MTLLEVLLAIALVILLLSGIWQFYLTMLRARKEGADIAKDAILARSILSGLAREIEQATSIVPGDRIGFQGRENEITIVCYRMPDKGSAYAKHESMVEKPPPGQMDLLRIRYYLVWDEETESATGDPTCLGLHRSEQWTLDPNPTYTVAEATENEAAEVAEQEEEPAPVVFTEPIAPEVNYVKFEYFDGAQWRDRWQVPYEDEETEEEAEQETEDLGAEGGYSPTLAKPDDGEYALPLAVRITIGREAELPDEYENDISVLEEEEELEYHPDRFTTTVYLRQSNLFVARKHGVDNDPELQTGGL